MCSRVFFHSPFSLTSPHTSPSPSPTPPSRPPPAPPPAPTRPPRQRCPHPPAGVPACLGGSAHRRCATPTAAQTEGAAACPPPSQQRQHGSACLWEWCGCIRGDGGVDGGVRPGSWVVCWRMVVFSSVGEEKPSPLSPPIPWPLPSPHSSLSPSLDGGHGTSLALSPRLGTAAHAASSARHAFATPGGRRAGGVGPPSWRGGFRGRVEAGSSQGVRSAWRRLREGGEGGWWWLGEEAEGGRFLRGWVLSLSFLASNCRHAENKNLSPPSSTNLCASSVAASAATRAAASRLSAMRLVAGGRWR